MAHWMQVARYDIQPGSSAAEAIETFVGDLLGDKRRRSWVWVSTKLGTFAVGDGTQFRIRFGDMQRTHWVIERLASGGSQCVT